MKTRTKVIGLLLSLCLITVMVFGALGTGAWFSDQEKSTGNSINAGTLDLTIDGVNTNVVKFNVVNACPGNQPTGNWILKNDGTIGGKLSIESINVTQTGGIGTEPEAAAGDPNNLGNLGELVNISLYVDTDKDGYFSTGDVMFYDGLLGGLDATAFNNLNLSLAANANIKINAVINWWSHNGVVDNQGQGDTLSFDINFLLTQNHG